MMPLVGAGAACALVGFPKTKLVDDSPLIGAGACHCHCHFRAIPSFAQGRGIQRPCSRLCVSALRLRICLSRTGATARLRLLGEPFLRRAAGWPDQPSAAHRNATRVLE